MGHSGTYLIVLINICRDLPLGVLTPSFSQAAEVWEGAVCYGSEIGQGFTDYPMAKIFQESF